MIKLMQSLFLVMLASIVFQANAAPEDKPFAEHKVVLQISDADPTKQTLVLNVANNLMKAYGSPDKVDVEIVAFGPGLRLQQHHQKDDFTAGTRAKNEQPGRHCSRGCSTHH